MSGALQGPSLIDLFVRGLLLLVCAVFTGLLLFASDLMVAFMKSPIGDFRTERKAAALLCKCMGVLFALGWLVNAWVFVGELAKRLFNAQ